MGELRGHVPEENLSEYRLLRRLANDLDSMGGHVSNRGDYEEANILWAMSKRYNDRALNLRTVIFDKKEVHDKLKAELRKACPSVPEDGLDALIELAEQQGLEMRTEQQPPWLGDREYLQQMHDKSWTPEKYGGSKG